MLLQCHSATSSFSIFNGFRGRYLVYTPQRYVGLWFAWYRSDKYQSAIQARHVVFHPTPPFQMTTRKTLTSAYRVNFPDGWMLPLEPRFLGSLLSSHHFVPAPMARSLLI